MKKNQGEVFMAGKKQKRLKKSVKILIGLVIILMIGAVGITVYAYESGKKAAYEETYNSLSMTVDQDKLTVEYGSEYVLSDLVVKSSVNAVTKDTVDTYKIGDQDVTYTLSDTDSYGKKVTREYTYTVVVQDTVPPVIELNQDAVVLAYGEEYDVSSNIASVKDPVDGDLQKADTLSEGTYTVTSDLDINTAGDYQVNIQAMDQNGNEADRSYTITVEEEVVVGAVTDESVSVNTDAAYPYYIRINRAMNTVTIYTQNSDGNYTVPYKAMVCSTGDATPLGVYNTTIKYRWRALYGGVYGQYATRIVDSILFHSVPYYSESLDDLEYDEYNKLGTAASMGCIRLCVADVKWIYDNCPIGTTVEIYDDYTSPGPLGKPTPITIDTTSPNRGWDPTDPDPANPWNQ